MFKMLIGALALLATATPAFASPCNGVDLAVGSVSVKNVSTSGGLNHYNITGSVTNVGSASQGADALQFVDIYQGKDKLDSRSVPPLNASQSYTFSYISTRSTDAGNGTTRLRFQLNVKHPSPADSQICNMANDSFTLTF
jgi:hypothetical protein